MLFRCCHPGVKRYLDDVLEFNKVASRSQTEVVNPSQPMQRTIGLLLTGILVIGTFCLSALQRASCGALSVKAVSELIHRSKLESVLYRLSLASLGLLISLCRISSARICIDECQVRRAKSCKKIFGAFWSRDRKTGGRIRGQEWVVLYMVTDRFSLPVLGLLYQPDPNLSRWAKEDKRLRKAGVPARSRPKKPARNKGYPSKIEIACSLVRRLKYYFPKLEITAILADCLYGTHQFLTAMKRIHPKTPVISQLKQNQLSRAGGRPFKSLGESLGCLRHQERKLPIRGVEKTVFIRSARLYVKALKQKVHVVSLRYEGETESRFLFCQELSLTQNQIVTKYSERWLIEVFFHDWKCSEGFSTDMLQAKKGAYGCIHLSLLIDHYLLYAQLKRGGAEQTPLLQTVGSERRAFQLDVLHASLSGALLSDSPQESLDELIATMRAQLVPRISKRHLPGFAA